MEPIQHLNAIPKEIHVRLEEWKKMYYGAYSIHYLVGIAGIIVSLIAALGFGIFSQVMALLACISILILGFFQPQKDYFRYAHAWQMLSSATAKYKRGEIDLPTLLAVLDKGEQYILKAKVTDY